MKDDSHIHLFQNEFLSSTDMQTENQNIESEVGQYMQLRKFHGIDRALVIGYEGTARFQGNNSYILELARVHKWINPLAYLDLSSIQGKNSFRETLEFGFIGFSIYLDPDVSLFSNSIAMELNNLPGEGRIISINAGPDSLEEARSQIESLDTCSVLISHIGLPGPKSTEDAESLRERLKPLLNLQKYEHVFVKISGLYAVDPTYPHLGARDYVEEILEKFGPSRLMWGSDFAPSLEFNVPSDIVRIPEWLTGHLSSDELRSIYSENLQGILNSANNSDLGI
jgi:predicted TIM-barrel fold metal-dependent hydrolase